MVTSTSTNSKLEIPAFLPIDDPISSINKAMAFLGKTQSYPRNNAAIGKVRGNNGNTRNARVAGIELIKNVRDYARASDVGRVFSGAVYLGDHIVKLDEYGGVLKNKARLVAKGYRQEEKIDLGNRTKRRSLCESTRGVRRLGSSKTCVQAKESPLWVEENSMLLGLKDFKIFLELLLLRKPALSFMRPFGCPVTILNTLDHLGKFDGKADEGFFVGYSTNSKAYRVFSCRISRIVEENLHVKFRNQTNGNAGTKENIDAGQARKKIVPDQEYILLPLLTSDPSLSKSSKDSPDAGFKPSGEEEKMDSEHLENKDSKVPNIEEPRVHQEQDANLNNTNNINTVCLTVNAADIENNVVDENIVYGCIDDLNMPNLEEIVYYDDDEEVGAKANMNNLATNVLNKKDDRDDAQEIPDEFYGGAHFLLRVAALPWRLTKHYSRIEGSLLAVDVISPESMIGSIDVLTASRLRDSPFDLEAFSDSNYADASLDKKSTIGGCQFLRRRRGREECWKGAATTASNLEAEQDSGNINRTQSMATLNESFPQRTDSGSGPRVNTLRSREDNMKLKELIEFCTKLSVRALDL
ncbi:retrovirus-related pol polyprotein from transposon TNT 1-94 [Tanacetum coccineum]